MTLGAAMSAEMAEQPARLAALLGQADAIAGRLREVLPEPLAGTVLIARGSSDHAATTGRYLLELATRRPVASASPSLYTMYGAQTDFTGFLVVAASQSGRTPEIVRSLQLARARGGHTVAITNDRESPLALAAELPLHLGVGTERAVPATKTVTAELVAFALVAQAVRDIGFGPQVRDQLSGQVAAVLDDPGPAAAERVLPMRLVPHFACVVLQQRRLQHRRCVRERAVHKLPFSSTAPVQQGQRHAIAGHQAGPVVVRGERRGGRLGRAVAHLHARHRLADLLVAGTARIWP